MSFSLEARTPRRGSQRPLRRGLAWASVVAVLALTAGCRQDMHDQPRYEPLEASAFFADGVSARPMVRGTVARGDLRADQAFYTGRQEDGDFVREFPFELTHQVMERGRERYDIFCSPCHDRLGSGRGMIVRRGFRQPTSFHAERLRAAPPGYFVDVMTNGFGLMSSYASMVPAEDRWAITAYIRALQMSQNAQLAELPESVRKSFLDEAAEGE